MIGRTLLAAVFPAGVALFFGLLCPASFAAPTGQKGAEGLGISVVLAGPATETAIRKAGELAHGSRRSVYLQVGDEQQARAAGESLDTAGLLGTQIWVEAGSPKRIHLADNLADEVIIPADAVARFGEHREELLRVVNPLGHVQLGDEVLRKPVPEGVDAWTHPYHGPDNNPQSTDRIARAPYRTQFLAEPWYVPMPEVTVAAGGRLFKAFGHVAYKAREWPWRNTLVALNGYNGTMLWKRALSPDFMIHRNTMIATPNRLYLADHQSCKLLDAASGRVVKEIAAPAGSENRVWKWMAMEGKVLYALLGPEEPRDEGRRDQRTEAGWPWQPMSRGYDAREYAWGFGRVLLAMDAQTGHVLWRHNEQDLIDGRAMCMKDGRIYAYAHPRWLACYRAADGKMVWRGTSQELLDAIGPHDRAQAPTKGFSSSSYLKCSGEALYFAGPQRKRLVAASTHDGRLLWQAPDGNVQLVLRKEGLYAMGRLGPSKVFDPLTGKVLAELDCLRGNCTRATGAIDSILARGHSHGGTLRVALPENETQRIALMRPDCHSGVIISNGISYWGPWMCDCNLSLVGVIALAPAGDSEPEREATDAERLTTFSRSATPARARVANSGDWPTYRADNQRSAATAARVSMAPRQLWSYVPRSPREPAAPIIADGIVYHSGSDGVIRALEAATGKVRYSVYTGGAILFPPSVEGDGLFAGSSDGYVYAWQAADGRPWWRFEAAPARRKIPVYGRLSSTWPVASGVIVERGTVYAAAGIASYDGTHVYALDAVTGRIRWQNNRSGHLAGGGQGGGVSVQGHLLLKDDRLYLAGGNVVSPAVFDAHDGQTLSSLDDVWQKSARGRDLFVVAGQVTAFEQLLYAPRGYQVGRYYPGHLVQANRGEVILRGLPGKIVRIDPKTETAKRPKTLWESDRLSLPSALALAGNAVVVAGRVASDDPIVRYALVALSIEDGRILWQRKLPAEPVKWGLAIDAKGRMVVSLDDGRVVAFGE